MSLLVENILKKQNQRKLHEFNMTSSPQTMTRSLNNTDDVGPIKPKVGMWQQIIKNNIELLQRSYSFQNTKLLMYFLDEVYHIANDLNHHPILIIDNLKVDVELYTRDINQVTHVDIVLSEKINQIVEEININNFSD